MPPSPLPAGHAGPTLESSLTFWLSLRFSLKSPEAEAELEVSPAPCLRHQQKSSSTSLDFSKSIFVVAVAVAMQAPHAKIWFQEHSNHSCQLWNKSLSGLGGAVAGWRMGELGHWHCVRVAMAIPRRGWLTGLMPRKLGAVRGEELDLAASEASP